MANQRREIFRAMLIVAALATLCGGYAMAQPKNAKLWECNRCKQQRWESREPSSPGCPKGGGHLWYLKK